MKPDGAGYTVRRVQIIRGAVDGLSVRGGLLCHTRSGLFAGIREFADSRILPIQSIRIFPIYYSSPLIQTQSIKKSCRLT